VWKSSDDDFEHDTVVHRTPLSTALSRKLSLRIRQQQKINSVSENDTFFVSSDPTGKKTVTILLLNGIATLFFCSLLSFISLIRISCVSVHVAVRNINLVFNRM